LSHLSKNNNSPELVEQLFAPHANNIDIVVASRYAPSPVFCLEGTGHTAISKTKRKVVKNEQQLSLF
jgi:hypothetical protein